MSASDLELELRRNLRGDVRFDPASRAIYATDASNYRQPPIGVVLPFDARDVETTLEICRRHDAPVLPRGAGTSLAGQCCNVAVVLDFSRHMNQILEIDPARRIARVQPGVVLDRLREAAAPHGLTFGPDPATHAQCTLGGMLGNNSCGVHSVMAGRTADNVEQLEVLTYEGLRLRVGATDEADLRQRLAQAGPTAALYAGLLSLRDRHASLIRERYPRIPRRVSGYNLDELLPERGFQVARALVGSEGTCATILEATLRLIPSPRSRALLVLGFEDIFQAADHVPEILAASPIGLEGMNLRLIEQQRKKRMHPSSIARLPAGEGWLLVEFGGETPEEAEARAAALLRGLGSRASHRLCLEPAEQKQMWEVRESALASTARTPGEPDTWEGWEDAAVAPERLGAYLREFSALVRRHGYTCALYGHFGDGCVHNRLNFDFGSHEGLARMRAFLDEAVDLVLRYGGSLSGEHGDGQARAEFLPRMFGDELVSAFGEFKRLWDPRGRMNPGKLVNAYKLDENLKHGPPARGSAPGPRQGPEAPGPPDFFQFPEDEGAFERAVSRCVGVGKCRKDSGGTMCPSFRATREEMHSPRGRANLLSEMLRGELIVEGWQSEEVREALDLCLSCKGCKKDCPTGVDIASYKAEFLSHHYRTRWRPLVAHLLAKLPSWTHWTRRWPWLANQLAAKFGPLLGLVSNLPQFQSHGSRGVSPWRVQGGALPSSPTRPQVLLWPDTISKSFQPEIAEAATETLQALGFEVLVPPALPCCGRPLYDHGWLAEARAALLDILTVLSPYLQSGTPILVLEPSCLSVFRDELPNLLPGHPEARRLQELARSISEFFEERQLPAGRLSGRALLHGHCHQKALWGVNADRSLLRRMGLEVDVLDAGCCGMAGAFGLQRKNSKMALRIAEQSFLPGMRSAKEETYLVLDGFSCREQLRRELPRKAVHVAQLLRQAAEHTEPAG